MSTIFQRMKSLAFKKEVSQKRVDRLRGIIALEQLASAHIAPYAKGDPRYFNRNKRKEFWGKTAATCGWPDGLAMELPAEVIEGSAQVLPE